MPTRRTTSSNEQQRRRAHDGGGRLLDVAASYNDLMSFLTVLWVLTIFWTVVYSFKARDGRSTIILPTTTTHSASPSRTHRYKSKKWNITIQNLHLRAETSSLNDGHDLLAQVLSRRKFLKATLKRFYDFGVLFGVAGFLAGIVVMGLSSHNLILKLVDFPSGDRVSSGVKRELMASQSPSFHHNSL